MTTSLTATVLRLARIALIAITIAPGPVGAADNDVAALETWLAEQATAPADGLAPGHYGQDRLADLGRYVPPGLLEEMDFPELDLELVATRSYAPHRAYLAATARFAGQARIAADGHLLGYVAGMPFAPAQITAAGADTAGFMVAWNHVQRWENLGFAAPETVVSFIRAGSRAGAADAEGGLLGGGVVERQMVMSYRRVYLSKLAPLVDQDYRLDVDGSDEVLFKERIEILAPHAIAGTTLIVERPLDQAQGDLVNSYLPTERRVRRLSAKERADSWMGTNWTLDDFGGYAGLVMDNTWRLLGHKVIANVADTRHAAAFTHGPLSSVPLDRWQLRPCYVVEAVPRWSGHPYGRRVLFVDAETFSVALTLIYDRADALYKIINSVYERSEDPDPEPSQSTSRMRASIVVDVQNRTANVARVTKPTDYSTPELSLITRTFSVADLNAGR